MSPSSPGYSSLVQIVPEKKKRNLNLCIICQRNKDVKGSIKLTGTPEGRNHSDFTETTRWIFIWFDRCDLFNIKYHVKSYYAKHKESGERYTETLTPNKREDSLKSARFSPTSRQKMVKTTMNKRFICNWHVRVCVCVRVYTSIHCESFICLDPVGYQGTDQRCYVEDAEFLCWFPSLLL